jgi:hypothetical protein
MNSKQEISCDAWCAISPNGELYACTCEDTEYWAWDRLKETHKFPMDRDYLEYMGWKVIRVTISKKTNP